MRQPAINPLGEPSGNKVKFGIRPKKDNLKIPRGDFWLSSSVWGFLYWAKIHVYGDDIPATKVPEMKRELHIFKSLPHSLSSQPTRPQWGG